MSVGAIAVAHSIAIVIVTAHYIATRREAVAVSRFLERQQLWMHHSCSPENENDLCYGRVSIAFLSPLT